MTTQIEEILESMSDDSYFEDEAVILKTYIERLKYDSDNREIRIKQLESENAEFQQGKHCHGCKYACIDGTYSSFYKVCTECTRSGWHDCYEPKK